MSRWNTVKRLFDHAISLPKEDQEAYLEQACNGDEDLFNTVFSMLENNGGSSELSISKIVSNQASDLVHQFEELQPNSLIGSYRVVKKLADGGMGAVYKGRRADDSYEQHVAIKVLKAKINAPSTLKIFRQERQILADLNHPNIAHLLDGGTTQNGVPFIVMEYVDGKHVTDYLSERNYSLNEICSFFLQICDAVDYAHRNLVIHRDIKAENILINELGQVKLLDFGIASIDSERSLDYAAMTPYSASPEQVKGETISTASDIYSLAIIFYRMLGGAHVYGENVDNLTTLKDAIVNHNPRAISKTSQRVDLRNSLKGDIDFILQKALKKDPEERYSSAAVFAGDVRNVLRKLPVSARPQTPLYILGKLASRYPKTSVASTLAVVLFLGVITFYTLAINQARDIAEQRLYTAEQVSNFLVEVFTISDPIESLGNQVTARQVLDEGARTIEATLENQPEIQHELTHTLARVYLSLGILSQAEILLDREQRYIESVEISPEKLIRNRLAFARLRGLQGNIDGQYSLIFQALEQQKALSGESSLEYAKIAMQLVYVLQDQGKLEEALTLHAKSFRLLQQSLEGDSEEIINARILKNILYLEAGDYEKAVDGAASLHDVIVSKYGEVHPKTAHNLSDWGYYAEQTGDIEAAITLLQQALHIDTQIYGENHPVIMGDLLDLGSTMSFIDVNVAIDYLQQVIEMGPDTMSANHPSVAVAHNDLGSIYLGQSRLEKAEYHYLESLRINRLVFGDLHPDIATNLSNLGLVYVKSQKLAEAKTVLFEALSQRQQIMGEVHPHVAASISVLGNYYMALEEYPQALDFYTRSLTMKQTFYADSSEMMLTAKARVIRAMLPIHSHGQAKALLNQIFSDIGESDYIYESSQRYLVDTFALFIDSMASDSLNQCEQRNTLIKASLNALRSYEGYDDSLSEVLESKKGGCD